MLKSSRTNANVGAVHVTAECARERNVVWSFRLTSDMAIEERRQKYPVRDLAERNSGHDVTIIIHS